MDKLKSCPFCGGSRIKVYPNPNKDLRDLGIEQYKVSCVNCAAQLCRAGKEEAIEAWNRRAAFTTAHSEWINVKDRLPEEYKDVLCYYEYFRYGEFNCMFRTIDRGYYGNGIWGGEAGQGHKNKVLAWMPLPEPPKEET